MKILSLFLLCSALSGQEGPDIQMLEEEQRREYKCLLVEYEASPGNMVQSYLLVPNGATASSKCPGLVLLHDHGARFDIGKEKLVRPMKSSPEHVARSSEEFVRANFDGVYLADSLASMGYAVIVPDMLYWGGRSSGACQEWSRLKFGEDSHSLNSSDNMNSGSGGMSRQISGPESSKQKIDSLKKAVYEGQRAVYDSLAARGVVWAEQTLEEDACAARILAGLDFVDSENIGAFGWSMGAHRAWLLTAFCPEVKAGAALCWMTLKETVKTPYKASDYALLIPELREEYDFPDIAIWLAPKPFLFLNGAQDHLFPVRAVEKAFSRMQDIYEERGASGRLQTEFFDGGHHCGLQVQGRIVEFFEKNVPLQSSAETR